MKTQNPAIIYHERSKHHPNRYALSSGYLDWANEPVPFRHYEGAGLIPLPFLKKDPGTGYDDLYLPSSQLPSEVTLSSIGAFLELSLALSAWKSFGQSTWALRINPSSGNLHPTEAYLVIPPLAQGMETGAVVHYHPYRHALACRSVLDRGLSASLAGLLHGDGFFAVLTGIYWREAWKYGERAFRYCNLDLGHALACMSFSAGLQGWTVRALNGPSEEDLETLLGFPSVQWKESESEHPDILLLVCKNTFPANELASLQAMPLPGHILTGFGGLTFQGTPNTLSTRHTSWPVIDEISKATGKPRTVEPVPVINSSEPLFDNSEPFSPAGLKVPAARIIRARRSGRDYDGSAAMEAQSFFALLDRTIPRSSLSPFDLALCEPAVDLLLFVHQVNGLAPGMYYLLRTGTDLHEIQRHCTAPLRWEQVTVLQGRAGGNRRPLPLYLLKEGDYRKTAAFLCCHQEMAGNGVFCLAMIAKFKQHVDRHPSLYRYLFWEAGMIGQILYLEAEARSLRGTGIGCYFDDMTHELLGLSDNSFQSLYHFVIGRPIEDNRLTTLPPYHHLDKRDDL